MSRINWNSIAVSVLLGLLLSGSTQAIEPARPEHKITVVVYNYADVAGDVLTDAKRHATEVFRPAGLEIEWLQPSEVAGRQASREHLGLSTFVIRIVPDSMIGGWAPEYNLLGFSLILVEGEFSFLAGVYYQRAERHAREKQFSPALVLGHVMAHELGHLLLGKHSHSLTGIMSVRLQHKELELAAQGRLKLTRSQVQRIRANLRKRMRAEQAREG